MIYLSPQKTAIELFRTTLPSPKAVALANKNHWIISFILNSQGKKVVVSRYENSVWNLSSFYYHPLNITFSSCVFPDGSNLTARKHAKLCESVKDYLYTLLSSGLSVRTIYNRFESLKALLLWMVDKQGYQRFAEVVNPNDFISFAKTYIFPPLRNTKPRSSIGLRTIALRLQPLDDLWRLRDKLEDSLPQHPWPRRVAGKLAGRDYYRQPKTLAIPDDIFLRLINGALNYITHQAEAILAAQTEVELVRQAIPDERKARDTAIAKVRAIGFKGLRDLASEKIKLRTCCYVILAAFVGLRSSEGLSLEKNCVEITTLKVGNESYEAVYIHGRTYKGEKDRKGVAARWMANTTVVQAIYVLEKLAVPLQNLVAREIAALESIQPTTLTKAQAQQLFLARQSAQRLFIGQKGSRVRVITKGILNQDLKWLCKEFNMTTFQGELWDIHSHQFRRTLARFIARSRLGNIKYLQHHFKHWSSDLTWYYMQGDVDKQFVNFMDEEYTSYIINLYEIFLNPDMPLAGGRGEQLKNKREPTRDFLFSSNIKTLAQQLSEEMHIKAQPHSFCMAPKEEPFCGPECLYNLTQCIDCKNSVIYPEHLPVWQDMAERQREILALPCLGEPQKEDARQKLGLIEKLIASLEKEKKPRDKEPAAYPR